jgi:hypothetical protein
MHWSMIFVNYITIEATFNDGARQGSNYDCLHFATIEDLEANMAADFNLPQSDWKDVLLHITLNDEHHTVDLGVPEFESGQEFASQVMQIVGETLGWQPAVIS